MRFLIIFFVLFFIAGIASSQRNVYKFDEDGKAIINDEMRKMRESKSNRNFTWHEPGAPIVGTNQSTSYNIPFNGIIKSVKANIETAPTGAAIICDINVNGKSIWYITTGNRITIADGATSGSSSAFDITEVTENQVLTIDIDQVGSTTAGDNLTVTIVIEENVYGGE